MKRQFLCDITSQSRDTYYENVKRVVLEKLNGDLDQFQTIEEFDWAFFYKQNLFNYFKHLFCRLGLLSEDPVSKLSNPIDSLAAYLSKRLVYSKIFVCINFLRIQFLHLNAFERSRRTRYCDHAQRNRLLMAEWQQGGENNRFYWIRRCEQVLSHGQNRRLADRHRS